MIVTSDTTTTNYKKDDDEMRKKIHTTTFFFTTLGLFARARSARISCREGARPRGVRTMLPGPLANVQRFAPGQNSPGVSLRWAAASPPFRTSPHWVQVSVARWENKDVVVFRYLYVAGGSGGATAPGETARRISSGPKTSNTFYYLLDEGLRIPRLPSIWDESNGLW